MRRDPILRARASCTPGIDWAAPIGTPVVAAAGGRVALAGVEGELGRTVRIDHGAGWQTVYAHLSAFDVREGDCVAALSIIGKVGSHGTCERAQTAPRGARERTAARSARSADKGSAP